MVNKRGLPLAQAYRLLESGPVVLVTTCRAGRTSTATRKFCAKVGRVTPCAPCGRPRAGGGAHGVTRPTLAPGHVSKLPCRRTSSSKRPRVFLDHATGL